MGHVCIDMTEGIREFVCKGERDDRAGGVRGMRRSWGQGGHHPESPGLLRL